MKPRSLTLKFELLSAATFGRGDGLPGVVDAEIEHDQWGLPYLRGRTLRGLIAEEMHWLLFVLDLDGDARWALARDRLLGASGRMTEETGILHIGDARLPENLRVLIGQSVDDEDSQVTRLDVLEALTAIRRQTAVSAFGAPDPTSLRSMRIILRGTVFESNLTLDEDFEPLDAPLLAATVLAFRRAGTGRNRGRGRLRAWLENDDWMIRQFELFRREVQAL